MKKIKKVWWVGALLIIVVVVIVVVKKNKPITANFKSQEILLNSSDIISVKNNSIDDVAQFTGDLEAKNQTIISSEIDALVTKIYVDEGQMVKAGQILAQLDSSDSSQAVIQQQAQVAGAKSKLELDKQKLEKQKELYNKGFISKIGYEELINNYQTSLQSYNAQAAMLIRSIKQLSDTKIKAPFDGIIYQKSIQTGQLASKNTKLFSLADLSSMEIKAAIPSDKINQIGLGQQVIFKVETDSQSYQGKVIRINQVAQDGTRSYLVYIDFDNHINQLKSGQFVKGQIILRHLENQLVVPCDAIRSNNNNKYIFIVENNKIIKSKVQLVLQNNETNSCAVKGLIEKALVVAGNVTSVKPGDKIKLLN